MNVQGDESRGKDRNHPLTGSETFSSFSSTSSALVSLFKKLLSLTGLPACTPGCGSPATLSLCPPCVLTPEAPPPFAEVAGAEGFAR